MVLKSKSVKFVEKLLQDDEKDPHSTNNSDNQPKAILGRLKNPSESK